MLSRILLAVPGARVVPATKTAFQLRISLKDHVPVIWRRLLVPGEIKLSKLHLIFQAAMGWEDYHLHSFEIAGERYGVPDPDWEIDDIDDETVRITDVVGERAGSSMSTTSGTPGTTRSSSSRSSIVPLMLKFAVCLDGQRACPPEDWGGPAAMRQFARGARRPDDTRSTTITSAGSVGCFDPEAFDLAARSTPPSSGCADQVGFFARLALVERSRKLSVPVSMMWALKVSRSTMAATRRGSPITWPHS